MAEQSNSIYTPALVTFIDILGFKEMIQDDVTGNGVKNVVSHLRHFGTMDLEERYYHGFKTYHFSDSIIRCTPLVNDKNYSLFVNELEELTYIQGELSGKNILIRGGITCGDVYIGEHGVFGPAFIDAYTLESKHARYPRIIIHPSLIAMYATQGKSGFGVYADDGLCLTREENDGFYFIDYLMNFPREVHTDRSPDREEIALSYIQPRKELIEANIAKSDLLSTIRSKYVWLGHYHNTTAKELLPKHSLSVLLNERLFCEN